MRGGERKVSVCTVPNTSVQPDPLSHEKSRQKLQTEPESWRSIRIDLRWTEPTEVVHGKKIKKISREVKQVGVWTEEARKMERDQLEI